MALQTINARVRDLLRVTTTQVPDATITREIEYALVYVNRDTESSKTISSYATSNTDNAYFDELIAWRTSWTIAELLWGGSVQSATASGQPVAAYGKFEQSYLAMLAVDYPQKVAVHDGRYFYATQTTASSGDGGVGGPQNPYSNTYILDSRPDNSGFRTTKELSDL